jgi:D-alanyl-D-alanine carboxypeptidase
MLLRFLLIIGFVMSPSFAEAADNPLEALAFEIAARDPGVPSVVVHARSPRFGIDWTGDARGTGETGPGPLAGRPFRIASVTKLFVAAAVLRLVEQDRLSLNGSIDPRLSDSTRAMLVNGGYDPGRITVSQLLSHTSGLGDHSTLPSYLQAILANGQRRWTRGEQIALAVSEGRKAGEPRERQAYSDTGYLLLAEIIEEQTAQPLASSIRHLLRFDHLGLEDTWFETLEAAPRMLLPRLTQYLGKSDVTDFDPSFDLWGGGGIVSTVRDLATFMDAFAKGLLFERAETLAIALSGTSSKDNVGSDAHHGLVFFEHLHAGHHCIGHAGFWNVDLVACPDLDLTVVVTLNQPATARPDERRRLVGAVVAEVQKAVEGRR